MMKIGLIVFVVGVAVLVGSTMLPHPTQKDPAPVTRSAPVVTPESPKTLPAPKVAEAPVKAPSESRKKPVKVSKKKAIKALKASRKKPKAVKVPKRTKVDEAAIRRDCAGDAWSMCASSIPMGRQAIIACMVKNKKNLSKACAQHVGA